MAAALPLRMAGMAWYRPAIRPRLQAANDMAAPGQGAQLQAVLESNYASLHRRLARHLGCAELASDSLHDAWLRLGTLTAGDGAALAHSPVAYVFRVACNAAMDSLRRNRAWLYADEGDGGGAGAGAAGLVDFLADTAAGPERLAELQADVRRLAQAVELLPRRHRQVLEALRVDELTRQEVAERHDMSLRNVDTALRQALDHCARHTGYAAQGGVGTTRRGLRLNVRSRTDA